MKIIFFIILKKQILKIADDFLHWSKLESSKSNYEMRKSKQQNYS